MASPTSGVPEVYAYRDRQLLSRHHEQHGDIPDYDPSKIKEVLGNPDPSPTTPVCIIGAGMAGLYTAMIFESLGISYQIVDADTRARVGGRLFTYCFPNGNPYDYYDIGAMRFPDTPFMARVFDLVENRNLSVKFIPYVMESPNTFWFFNNRRIKNRSRFIHVKNQNQPILVDNQDQSTRVDNQDQSSRIDNQDQIIVRDPFHVLGYVDDSSLTTPQGVARRVSAVLEPFRKLFRTNDIATAIEKLYEQTDDYSMRGYMSHVLKMDDKDISWCETLDKSTGWYDRSLAENVLESVAFDWPIAQPPHWPPTPLPRFVLPPPYPNAEWKCFDGGSSTLPDAIFHSLSVDARVTALFQSPVTAISRNAEDNTMRIEINNTPCPRSYSAVISTVPLPCLSLMDLTGVNINSDYAQWSAIRELQYSPATKIGIKFSCPWWEEELQPPIHGGQSFTDLPIRTIVYPSYPPAESPEAKSRVLIVSYCWTQDADRVSAFINRDGTVAPRFIDVVFRDLAAVHNVNVEWLRQFDTGEYFAWDWQRDPLTMGGFALFGPGVYENGDIFTEIIKPAANGKLFFAGEATSSCHGWVAGALNSAWRAVEQYLTLNQPKSLEKFWGKWGPSEYLDEAPNLELVELSRKLLRRHLVIALHQSGFRIPT